MKRSMAIEKDKNIDLRNKELGSSLSSAAV